MKFKKIIILPVLAASAVVFSSCVYKTDASNLEATPDIIPVIGEPQNDPISGYCYVTFDANGTVFKNDQGQPEGPIRAFQVRRGHTWERIKHNTNMPDEAGDCLDKTQLPNKVFQGWVTADNKHLFDNFVFNEDNVKINAKWGKEYEPTEFVEDTWDMLIQVAEKGYDELKNQYLPIDVEGLTDEQKNTFIILDTNNPIEVQAKTRYVEIEGLHNPLRDDDKWPVHVVGINHDLIEGYNDKVASLTFQFSYAVNPVIAFNPSSRELGSEVWETSTLRNYLDTTLMYQFDSELLSGLQTVSKNTDDGKEKDKISSLGEKVFLPSVSEILTKDKIGTDQQEYFNYNENSLYDYYRYHLENTFAGDRSYLLTYNPFDLDADSNPKQINAWLRSPAYANISSEYQGFAGYLGVDENDVINAYGIRTDRPLAVAPCFAVGLQDVPSVTLSGTNDTEIQGINDFASQKEGYTATMKMKYDSEYALPNKEKISISIDGTPLDPSKFDFTSDGSYGTLTITDKTVIPECTSGSPSHNIDISITPIEDKFKSCSWEFLNETSNKGWDALKETFERTSFVGNEKMLTVNGVKYRVRVVQDYDPQEVSGEPSESADNLVGGGKAPLTFEFVTVADNSSIEYDSTTTRNFIESNLNSYLNDWGDKLDEATGGVAPVIKLVNTWDPDSTQTPKWVSTSYETKAFVISYDEFGGGPGHEGKQYKYYSENYDYDTYAGKNAIIKYLDNEQTHPVDYWTRSPDWNDSTHLQNEATYVEFNGDFDQEESCSNKHYVAPAFCLGGDIKDAEVKFGGDGYTIDGQEPSTYTKPSRFGEQVVIDKIKVKQNAQGDYPLITEDNIVMTSIKEGAFSDYTLTKPTDPDGDYSITINHAPSSDLYVSIAASSNDCVTFSLIGGENAQVGFTQFDSAPSAELQSSTDGGQTWQYHRFGIDKITLDSSTTSVSFKASDSDGVPNSTFANVTIDDSGNITRNGYTKFNVANPVGDVALSVSGNIMSLLGDGDTIPTTIGKSGAFYEMFSSGSRIADAAGLLLPAKGVDTTNPPTEVKATYAHMFYMNTNLVIPPAKITGFNSFTDSTEVSHTYDSMFYMCANLAYAPQTDFSVATPYMCREMYAFSSSLYRADSSTTGVLATGFAPHCFERMFEYCGELVYGPTVIGSIDEKAAEYCCSQMFDNCTKLSSLVSISCSEGADSSFYRSFYYCPSLTHAIINILHLGVHIDTFKECFRCEDTWGDPGSLTNLTMPSLQLTSIDWPSQLMFHNWLYGQVKKGVLSCTQSVANALEGLHGPDFIPDTWSLRVINH